MESQVDSAGSPGMVMSGMKERLVLLISTTFQIKYFLPQRVGTHSLFLAGRLILRCGCGRTPVRLVAVRWSGGQAGRRVS